MKIACYSCQPFDKTYLFGANDNRYELHCWDTHLNEITASMAASFKVVSCFVNDCLNAEVIKNLSKQGVEFIVLRSAGFNHVDLAACKKYGIRVARVPRYSPYAVAEHAVGLVLTLNRKLNRAYNRIREHDFSLHGLLGFDLHGKTVGVIGTGQIGSQFAKIMLGFGMHVLATDPCEDELLAAAGVKYVALDVLLRDSHVISLHCPLNTTTRHLIDAAAIAKTRAGFMLINTSRGALVDTPATISALKSGHLGYLGVDVYEEEQGLFFEDHSDQVINDDIFARLLTFPNVIVTGHQAFFTEEALKNIAKTTINNIEEYEAGVPLTNEVL